MPKSPRQKLKLLYLIKILKERSDENHPLSAAALIQHLEEYDISAERKSIYDDIAQLQDFGYDIVLSKNRENAGYYLASREFELPELKVLVDVIQASRFLTKKKSEELISKLEQFANQYDARQLRRQIYVANRVKASNEKIYYIVDQIHHAMQMNLQIVFPYLNWNMKKELEPRKDGKQYTVSPWSLAWYGENYYLIAYDEEDKKIKHFRVDKMGTITMGEKNRNGQEAFEDFHIAEYCNKTFNMYSGKDETVTLLLENRLLGVIIDRFGQDISLRSRDKEHFSVRVYVSVSSQFFGWLAGIGKGIRILAPEDVRDGYKQYLQDLLENM